MQRVTVVALVVAALTLALVAWFLWPGSPGEKLSVDAANALSPMTPVATPRPPPRMSLPLPTPESGAEPTTARPPHDAAPRLDDASTESDAGRVIDEGLSPEALRAQLRAWAEANAKAAERAVDAFCAEARHAQRPPEPPRTRDAAIYLGVRTDWEGTPTSPPRVGLLHLPAALEKRMATPPGNWLTLTERDWAGLDFSWLQALAAYDYWSLSVDGPVTNFESLSFLDAPVPNFVTLMSWSKLRLVKGWHEGRLPEAAQEVRHLADLIASTSTLIGEMIRSAMYVFERKVWEAAGQPPPDTVLSADNQQTLRRVAFASFYFLAPGVPRAVKEKALACSSTRCSGLMEAIGQHAAWRDAAPDLMGDADWLMAQSPCDPALARRLANGPPATLVDLAGSAKPGGGLLELYPEDAGR